ncbi:MAG: DUF58 domain-containing protein [Candidatus Dormibacteria bacterium]
MKRLLFAAGLLVLLFFAYLTAVRLAYSMLYAIVLLVGLSYFWSRVGADGVELQRGSPEGAYEVGEPFSEPITVTNRAPISLPWVEVIDRSNIPGYDAGKAISLGARRSRRWHTSGRFQTRGRFHMGPMEVVTGDPFGFFQRKQQLSPSTQVTVYPRLLEVGGFLPGSALAAGDTTSAGRFVDSPPDAFGIREHDPMDGFNRIHWPSTARMGRPMSKSFEKFEGSDITIVLDLEHGVHRGAGQVSTLEYAVSLAASVASTAVNRGQSVGLACNDRRQTTIPAGRGGIQLRRMLDFLAIAEATGTTPLDTLLRGVGQDRGQQSLVVITPRINGTWVDRLAEIGRGGRRKSTVLHLDARSFETGPQAAPGAQPTSELVRWWEFAAGDELFVLNHSTVVRTGALE